MLRWLLVFAFTGLLSAQDPAELFHKPPAALDRALRERISQFYEMHVKGEFRQAEALVAEDTKDFFYDHNKPRYLSFEIQKIKYNEDFTKAQAVILCEQHINSPGFNNMPMKVPTPSTWKLENGKWCWYVDQEKLRDSPFGRMTPGQRVEGGGTGGPPPLTVAASVGEFYKGLKTDKQKVEMKPGSVEHVTISNDSTAMVSLDVKNEIPGIRASLSRTDVKPGEKAVLSITALDDAESGSLSLQIKPVGPAIPIEVIVK